MHAAQHLKGAEGHINGLRKAASACQANATLAVQQRLTCTASTLVLACLLPVFPYVHPAGLR
jgi:hypothetical protein